MIGKTYYCKGQHKQLQYNPDSPPPGSLGGKESTAVNQGRTVNLDRLSLGLIENHEYGRREESSVNQGTC